MTSPPQTTEKRPAPLPVTLLSGFLGSGKTTLLKHILHHQSTYKIACIVNDMAPLNIDAALIEQAVVQRKPELVKMQNGCICCTLRQDLVDELVKLAESSEHFDYILIESTGISEPMQVAESFTLAELPELVRLDTCVTVVDVPNFHCDLFNGETYRERFQTDEDDEEEGPKHVSHLLLDQVEFANVILLNKVDLVQGNELTKVRKAIEKLNPKARIIETTFSKVGLEEIINTGSFNLIEAQAAPGWLQSLQETGTTLQSELDEYGVMSFVYRRRKPFDPVKLQAACLLEGGYFFSGKKHAIIRSKGFVWIAGPEGSIADVCYEWEQAGSVLKIWPSSIFFSGMPEEDYMQIPEEIRSAIEHDWSGEYGDRRQELVFIGYKDSMNEEEIVRVLDECLLGAEDFERGPEHWGVLFEETFPEEFLVSDEEGDEMEVSDSDDMNDADYVEEDEQ